MRAWHGQTSCVCPTGKRHTSMILQSPAETRCSSAAYIAYAVLSDAPSICRSILRGMTLFLAPFFGVVLVPTMRIPRLASPLHDVQERCFPLVVAEPLLQRGPRGDAGGTHHTTELVGLEARSAVAVRGGTEIAQRDHAVCLGATWMLLEGQNDLLRLQNRFPRESACARVLHWSNAGQIRRRGHQKRVQTC